MTNPIAITRNEVENFDAEPRVVIRKALLFWCPGCDKLHRIIHWQREDQTGPVWDWDGNLEAPTISPSVMVSWHWGPDNIYNCCHSFVKAGNIQFLSNCSHELRSQTVPLPPVPDWMVKE